MASTNGPTIYYQDIIIPAGLNLDDVLHMAAHILEQSLEGGMTSNDDLRENVQRGLDSLVDVMGSSVPPPPPPPLEPAIDDDYGSAINWLHTDSPPASSQQVPPPPPPLEPAIEDEYASDIHWLHPTRIQGVGVPPPPEDAFWETVPVRLTEKQFEEQVDIRRMSKAIREKFSMDEPVCPICQEDINSRQHCAILTCGHIYHKKCIKEWLVDTCEQPTCPCCRKDVRASKPIEKTATLY